MPRSILIVDDNAEVRKALRSLLQDFKDHQVCGEAVDGVEAIAKANALRPDVVILDYSMPRMNGLDAARAIRPILPQTSAIVLFTVFADSVRGSQAASAGVDAVISKSSFLELLQYLNDKPSRNGNFQGVSV